MSEIQKYTHSYNLARNYLLFFFRSFYGQIIVKGKENLHIDDKSAVIFAPNHLNALMDALAVSFLMPPKKAVIYLARADLFHNKILARILRAAKILPAFRMRDGFENLGKNNKVFDECIDVLRYGHAICLMPEGGQGEQQKIRPLVKGIFRIAIDAQLRFGEKKDVKIIPIGIDFGDLVKCGKHIIINVGEPICVRDYMGRYHANPASVINEMKEELRTKLSNITVDLASSKYYDTFETIAEIMAEEYIENENDEEPAFEKFKRRQEAAKRLVHIEAENPLLMDELDRLSRNYRSLLKRLFFKSSVFSNLESDQTSFKRFLYLLITLPVFIFGFITNVIPMFLPVWIRKAMRIDYIGFNSSVQFGLGAILFPPIYLIQAFVFYCLISHNICLTFLFAFLQYATRRFTLRWYSNLRRYIHKNQFNGLLVARLEQSQLLYRLINTRNKIVCRVKNEQ